MLVISELCPSKTSKNASCNMCSGEKIRFTKKEAETALRKNKHSRKKYRKECRAYYCASCNAWHLTSREDLKDTDEDSI
jgi:hypothetical protein